MPPPAPHRAHALSVPTTAALPPTQLLPSTHPSVRRALSRLSRAALLSLALEWLEDGVVEGGLSVVYLAPSPDSSSANSYSPDPDDAYPPSSSLDELQEVYTDLQKRQGSKRDVLDRVLEGDWRDGISLYQLAMADMQYLYDHPTSQRWSALKIVALSGGEDADGAAERSGSRGKGRKMAEKRDEKIPRFHPSTFLRNLQRQVLPDVKAHYNLDRHADLPLWILRVWIVDSPYDTGLGLGSSSTSSSLFSTGGNGNANASLSRDASRTFYIAFPDAAPYIYVSLTTAANAANASLGKSLRNLTLESVPKAFSRPRERYALERTGLAARNLAVLCERRGGGRGNAAGGGWGVYYGAGERGEKEKERDNPLGRGMLMTRPESVGKEEEKEGKEGEARGMKRRREEDPNVVKRRKKVAQGRFGNSAKRDDGLGIERLDIRLEDPFPATRLFAEIEPPNTVDRASDKPRKRGRRSALEMELEREKEKQRDDADEDEVWRPDVRITLQGLHVFAGIRELVEAGIVDGQRMPGWMTGEEGVSIGVVRDGRIKGWKGSGV